MKKYSTLLAILFLIPFVSFAHFGDLSGKIYSTITQKPLQGAQVSLYGTEYKTETDSLGKYYFKNIPVVSYTMIVELKGYYVKTFAVNVKEENNNSQDVNMYPDMLQLTSIIIKGDKPQSAASSSTLNMVDFQLRPRNSAQDILRLVPGLFIAQHAGGGKAEQIFVRGFDCDHGTDVATFVDGIPVNMPSHGHGQGYADLHFLLPEVVKTMELYKGPYFAKFGDFATGAAVVFNTYDKLPNNIFQTEISSAPGHRNIMQRRGLILLNVPGNNENVSSYFAGELNYNPNYFIASQDFFRYTTFTKTTYKFNPYSQIGFSFNGMGSSWNASGQVPERAVASGLISRFGSIDNSEGGNTSRTQFNLFVNSKKANNEFQSQVYAGNYHFRLFSNFTLFLEDTIHGDEIEQTDDRNFFGYNGSYATNYTLGSISIKTTFGIGFRNDAINNALYHDEKRERLETKADAFLSERNMYAYISQQFFLSEKLKIEAALRSNYFLYDVNDHLPTTADSSHINYSGFNYQSGISPKLNIVYSPAEQLNLFFNSGYGFHSNDARSVVREKNNHLLPKVVGAEVGSLFRIGNRAVISIAAWMMESENELVYVGDGGDTEDKGSSRRRGVDLSVRYVIAKYLIADADINYSKNNYTEKIFDAELKTDNIIPLAPTLTSTGGLLFKNKKGIESTLRYRYMADRAANESNTVIARGYTVIDYAIQYQIKKLKIGINIENILNTKWNEAQFDTESRLKFESSSVDELHFTPGTPLALKLIVGINF